MNAFAGTLKLTNKKITTLAGINRNPHEKSSDNTADFTVIPFGLFCYSQKKTFPHQTKKKKQKDPANRYTCNPI